MSTEGDKYPPATGRRRFVKGVVGSATLGGLATAGAVTIGTATNPTGEGGGVTQYVGNTVISGPAPRGMPQIPVEIDDEGFVRGVWPNVREVERPEGPVTLAEMQLGGVTYSSEWFQYCGVQEFPGVAPDADQDNYFRYAESPPYAWQEEEVSAGDRVNVEDFADYRDWGNEIGRGGLGKPAMVTWRSQDVEPGEVMPVQLIRSRLIEQRADAGGNEWLSASTEAGFIANLNKCTHFCCVPGFKATQQSAQFGAQNMIYCPCHQSVYDPFALETSTFVAFPRPSE